MTKKEYTFEELIALENQAMLEEALKELPESLAKQDEIARELLIEKRKVNDLSEALLLERRKTNDYLQRLFANSKVERPLHKTVNLIQPVMSNEYTMKAILTQSKNTAFDVRYLIGPILYRAAFFQLFKNKEDEWFTEEDLEIHELAVFHNYISYEKKGGRDHIIVSDIYLMSFLSQYRSASAVKENSLKLRRWANENAMESCIKQTSRTLPKDSYSNYPYISKLMSQRISPAKDIRTNVLTIQTEDLLEELKNKIFHNKHA